ncbi:hemerythrin domain-containing protein [Kitasatospora sp. NPDC052868]|uniref:hemerythrin domain-containing protein n=1 Tax=Kitasatospora sp. NPDC052868 TaxID=3364060 RepID=UPI0037C78803
MSPESARLSSEHGLGRLPEHIRGFALMHVAMRRDGARLLAAAPRATAVTAAALAVWFGRLRAVIDWHHHSEDDLLWPELLRRSPGFAGADRALVEDHGALDEAMERVAGALAARGAGPAPLVEAAARFEALIREHLRQEESLVFPVIAAMPTGAYLALERRIIASAPAAVRTYLQPWMFDGADRAATAAVAATIPAPVRLLGNTVLARRYRRTLAPVL